MVILLDETISQNFCCRATLLEKKGKKKGGDGALQQEALLRDRPDIVVATPAGLVTHVRIGKLNLKRSVDTLVVDEADLILSFGEFLLCSRSSHHNMFASFSFQ